MTDKDKPARTEKFTINPELAKKWIALNAKNNRNVNQARVEQYARDMKAGKWKFNGETIKFSVGGALLDGQHRLRACIQAEKSFDTYVMFGLDTEAILTIDGGMPRTMAQMMVMTRGSVYAIAISGALTWLYRYQTDRMLGREVGPTRNECFALLDANPLIEMSVKRIYKIDLTSRSVLGFCHYLFARQDQVLADAFFDALKTGEDMKAGDPVFLLRERLISNRISKSKLRMEEIVALFFKAWQATKLGKPVKVLRWMRDEGFPSIADNEKTGVLYRRKSEKPKPEADSTRAAFPIHVMKPR